MDTKELILIRGLPGSGKSTLAESLSEKGKYPVFSIDDYFTSENGDYTFRHQDNHKAYKACEDACEMAMQAGTQKIFIDNVFSFDWEMEPYFKLATEYTYRIFVFTVENRHGGENIHGVSDDQLKRIAEKFNVKLM